MHSVAEKPSAAPILSITGTAKVGPLLEDIRSLRLCSTSLPHSIRLFLKRMSVLRSTRLLPIIFVSTFCGLVRTKSQRALSEFNGSLDVGLNLSVGKLQ